MTRKQKRIFKVVIIIAGLALLAGSVLPFIAYL
jgi:hypothetical protein